MRTAPEGPWITLLRTIVPPRLGPAYEGFVEYLSQRLPTAAGPQSPAPKKVPETDAIFANLHAKDGHVPAGGQVKRLSLDCKATANIGAYFRGGRTRSDRDALDHDMGCDEKYTPLGVLDEDTGRLHLVFWSSAKTSDVIVDGLQAWWDALPEREQQDFALLQIKADNGPESSGRRTQFLTRLVAFADHIGKPIQLLYSPPYHSKYNPVERCWGILERPRNGAQLVNVETMLGWAKSMTWKGLAPAAELSRQVYAKGISLSKQAMRQVEARLLRNPDLPQCDILIQPASLR